jgi:hypothetical protein
MATQTFQFYSNSEGSTASLVYDDVALTVSGVLVHVPAKASTVIVNAMFSGIPVHLTYPAGTDTTFSFMIPLPITIKTMRNGSMGINMPWFQSVSIVVSG